MVKKLNQYNQKRDFTKTEEPKGKIKKSAKQLKFVVQHHLASRDHYDFRLEWNGTLLSWAVPKGPSFNTADKRLAAHVEDHPLDYRNFEGNIPKGQYGGGVVMLWDEGYYEPQVDMENGIKRGSLKFILFGTRLQGRWALVRMNVNEGKKADNWLLIKEKDEFAKSTAGISRFKTSIRSGRIMKEIEAELKEKNNKSNKSTKNPFKKVDVQLAKLETTLPEGENWIYEIKYDGYRIAAHLEAGKVNLLSRNGNNYNEKFLEVADSLVEWADGRAMVLDGEMVVVTDKNGRTDFQALQSYIKDPKGKNLNYIIFDLLALDGEDLRENTLLERKDKLKRIMKNAPKNLCFSEHSETNGKEILQSVCKTNLEGLICKKADSVYSGTRNGDWIKIKCDSRQEFVIGGYTISEKKTSGISSILLGYFAGNELIYCGRAGTGFTQKTIKELEGKFARIKRKTSPFKNMEKGKSDETIIWLKPVMAAEIKFAEWTQDNILRQASFKGLRLDKNVDEIVREQPSDDKISKKKADRKSSAKTSEKKEKETNNETINLTNPQKLLFSDPEITKLEVAEYYQKMSKRMLPYVQKRILSLISCPDGVTGECFFKKHPVSSHGVKTVPVKSNSGSGEKSYFYINDVFGLIYQVQMNTLEFHLWGSSVDNLEKPDMMVFDLDPDKGMELKQIRQGVKDLKKLLDELELISFLKTSGGKGYHIVVPFKPSGNWEAFRDFSKNIASLMEQRWPDRYTSNVRKEKRKGKIFIDWMRNTRGATSIAPYSIRARAGARVSMPIEWSELGKVAPDGVDMKQAVKRLGKKDPWKDFFATALKQRFN